MKLRVENILAEYKKRLAGLYGARLAKLVLYGSQARGDAREGSDIDVLIVLNEPYDRWIENQRTSQATSEVSIQFGVDIARAFATEEDFRAKDRGFYRNIRAEGIAV